MPEFEYKTEVLTSMMGRDKMRMNDVQDMRTRWGKEGWELVTEHPGLR